MKKHFLLSAVVTAAVAVSGMGSMAVMAEDSTETTLETSVDAAAETEAADAAAETEAVDAVAETEAADAADEEEVIDLSVYSDDEIAELLKQINQEVVDRRLEKTAKLEPGVYTVGVDIPAGSYTYSVTVVADDADDDDDDRYTVDFDDDDKDDVDDADDRDDVDDADDAYDDADDRDDAADRWRADWENFDWEHFNWDDFKSNLQAEDILPHGNHGTLIVKNDDDLTPKYMSGVNNSKEFSAHLDLVEGDKLYVPFDGTLTIRTGVVFE